MSNDIDALADELLESVRDFIGRSLVQYQKRVDVLEQKLTQIPAGEKGEPGKDADAGEIFNQLRLELDSAVKAFTPPVDGKDGAPGEKGDKGDPVDPLELTKAVASGIDAALPNAVEVVRERVMAQLPTPVNGKDGIDGKDAPAVDMVAIQSMIDDAVAKAVAAIEIPVAKDGAPGKDAEPVDPVMVQGLVAELVGEAVAALPVAKDGADGKDGATPHPDTIRLMVAELVTDGVDKAVAKIPQAKDGAPGRDAADLIVLPGIDEARSYPAGTHALHRGGELRAMRATDPIKDGDVTSAGWMIAREGVAAITFTQGEDPRDITFKALMTSGTSVEAPFIVPNLIYKQVWREGSYRKTDTVTWAGSLWVAEKDTTDKPGQSDAWRLAVKSGAPGKDAAGVRKSGPVTLR